MVTPEAPLVVKGILTGVKFNNHITNACVEESY